MSFEIERLVGGLTPANPGDPRTFPAIWNETADELEAVEGRVTTAEGDISSLDGRVTTAEGDIGQLQTDVTTLDTDDVAEAGNLYYTDARVEAVIAGSDTDDLSEGVVNLYYTDARAEAAADVRIAAATTDDLSEGTANLYFTDQRADDRADGRIAAATTDDLSEGSTNLYYTDGRASAAAPVQSVNTQTGAVVLDLGDLDDVSIAGITDGQLIAYQASTQTFIPASAAGLTVGDITALNLTWSDF